MSNESKPVLNLNTPSINEKRKQLKRLNVICDSSFSNNANWRDKASYKLRRTSLETALSKEIRDVERRFKLDLNEYSAYMDDLKKMEASLASTTPIASISLSDVLDNDVNAKVEEYEFRNPIMDIEL